MGVLDKLMFWKKSDDFGKDMNLGLGPDNLGMGGQNLGMGNQNMGYCECLTVLLILFLLFF